jgi:ubiquinone/menaquinone biosynthesis C-methylase UbiE
MNERASTPTASALRRRIVSQFGKPRGILGGLVGLVMAKRSSNRERNRRTVELLQLRDTDRVLEVGFGPGLAIEMAARLASKGKVVGVDRSEMMLRQASRRNAEAIAAGRVELHLASAEALPAFAESFDKVMASNVLLFIEDPVATLRQWLGVIRPGGCIAITHQSRKPGATSADSAASAERVAADLWAAGFANLRIETLDMHPVNAACVLARRPA